MLHVALSLSFAKYFFLPFSSALLTRIPKMDVSRANFVTSK